MTTSMEASSLEETKVPEPVIRATAELQKVIVHLEALNSSSNCLFEHDFSELIQQLSSLEGAKLQAALAFMLASLFYMKMNICGKDLTKHPIHDELSRIKTFVAQLNQREKLNNSVDSESSNGDLIANKRPKLDAGAASRIIKHHT